MIIVKLMGGLGNQLFQYALAKNLSQKLGVELRLDTKSYAKDKLRDFELNHYNISAQPIDLKKEKIYTIKQQEKIRFLINKLLFGDRVFKKVSESKSNSYLFSPSILELPDNTYLKGFWQTEKYFEVIDSLLRQEFTLKTPPSALTQEMAQTINEANNSVSLHFRRSDYLIYPNKQTFSLDYYKQALALLTKQLGELNLFIFSDDPDWIKQNAIFNHSTTYVDHVSIDHPHEDLYLMSCCKHNVIANSTFSWWGAWLNNNPKKIIIAPKDWELGSKPLDIYPDSWIKI